MRRHDETRPAVSVIIPAYRASREIPDALASVFAADLRQRRGHRRRRRIAGSRRARGGYRAVPIADPLHRAVEPRRRRGAQRGDPRRTRPLRRVPRRRRSPGARLPAPPGLLPRHASRHRVAVLRRGPERRNAARRPPLHADSAGRGADGAADQDQALVDRRRDGNPVAQRAVEERQHAAAIVLDDQSSPVHCHDAAGPPPTRPPAAKPAAPAIATRPPALRATTHGAVVATAAGVSAPAPARPGTCR
jgi:hypothetical protein